jgi:hypothetical protein
MDDRDIRVALLDKLRRDDATAALFEELPLARGLGRADVASINGVIAGFEIKGERDSLRRLAGQTEQYDRVFEFVTAVVAESHLGKIRAAIPATWGIVAARREDGRVSLRGVRKPRRNHRVDAEVLARLLWKGECVRALANQGIRVATDRPILEMWARMVTLPPSVLLDEVRQALKRRAARAGLP